MPNCFVCQKLVANHCEIKLEVSVRDIRVAEQLKHMQLIPLQSR